MSGQPFSSTTGLPFVHPGPAKHSDAIKSFVGTIQRLTQVQSERDAALAALATIERLESEIMQLSGTCCEHGHTCDIGFAPTEPAVDLEREDDVASSVAPWPTNGPAQVFESLSDVVKHVEGLS